MNNITPGEWRLLGEAVALTSSIGFAIVGAKLLPQLIMIYWSQPWSLMPI